MSLKFSNMWVWDPGSGINKKPIPNPEPRIQGSKRHRILDPDPQHWVLVWAVLRIRDPGSGTFLTLRSGMGKKLGSGFGIWYEQLKIVKI